MNAGANCPGLLHVIRLPAYAPDLTPTEGVWSHLKRSLGNLTVRGGLAVARILCGRVGALAQGRSTATRGGGRRYGDLDVSFCFITCISTSRVRSRCGGIADTADTDA